MILRRLPAAPLVLAALLCAFSRLMAQEEGEQHDPFFYKGRDYGSDALFNPVSLLLNSSFDIIQLDGHSREIFSLPYRNGITNVWHNYSNPFGPISRYGWGNFIKDQLFPIDLTKKGAQWWPNYQLHLIGGGRTYTALREWYAAHEVPHPTLFAIGTKVAEVWLTETVENGAISGDNVDPIADLWLFDAGGVVLFSFEGINRFFSEELNLSDWSLQPTFVMSPLTLHNNGQYFSIKWKFPFLDRWHLFYYFGMNGLIGVSYKMDNGSAVSLGGGLRAKKLELVNAATNQKTLDLVWNAGVFYDRDNSLMASLFVSGLTDYTVSANVYPGILRIGDFSPGVWVVVSRDRQLLAGITTVWFPGLGFKAR